LDSRAYVIFGGRASFKSWAAGLMNPRFSVV